MEETGTIAAADGTSLAYRRTAGNGPGILFLGGFKSDMAGVKAEALSTWCQENRQAFCRFDYQGHGASGGDFTDGTIGRWAADAATVLDNLTSGPQILVGSSMGGWIAALLARAQPERLHAMVGIAPAPDFTEELMWPQFSPAIRATIAREGVWTAPSQYGEGYPITRARIEDGRRQSVLGGKLPFRFPVRILHGMRDTEVPWKHALRFIEAIEGDDVRITLVKDGDHRLSRPQDLALLTSTLSRLIA